MVNDAVAVLVSAKRGIGPAEAVVTVLRGAKAPLIVEAPRPGRLAAGFAVKETATPKRRSSIANGLTVTTSQTAEPEPLLRVTGAKPPSAVLVAATGAVRPPPAPFT